MSGRGAPRVVDWVGAVAAANLTVILIYELATQLTPSGASGWSGAAASAITAGVAGALAAMLLVRLRGGAWALATLALLVVLEATVSAQALASLGLGYASWTAEGVQQPGLGLRWNGWACGLCIGLAGRWGLLRWSRTPHPVDG